MAHHGEAPGSLAQLADDGEFVDPVDVSVGEFLYFKPQRFEDFG